eukprot:COSAG06_NODE_3052_length_5915_cov_4.348006_1_plen_154_part_10
MAVHLPLGEWLTKYKAAEYEATLRDEGCESVEDLVDSELTEQHLGELGFKMFAKIRVWGAIQSLRRAKSERPDELEPQLEPPTPPDADADGADAAAAADGDAGTESSRLYSKVPRFNRSDPSARTLTWSQASQADSQLDSQLDGGGGGGGGGGG